MKIIICRAPVVDGVVQETPITYFQKYTSACTPFFTKERDEAKRFDDYQDAGYITLERHLRDRMGFDWSPLEVFA
jgi:hypothetical protein